MAIQARKKSWWRFVPILLIGAGLVFAYEIDVQHYLTLDYLYDSRMWLKGVVAEHKLLSILGFFVFYTLAIAFVFPAPVILTIAGGFLFGWCIGGLVAIAGATIGGSVLFLAARTAFGHVLKHRAGGAIGRFADGFRRDAFTYLLVLRLTPVLPVAAVNIGPAFLDISLRAFALATCLGIVPGAMVYAFLGSGLDRALKRAVKREDFSIVGVMSTEMIVALVGLSLLVVLGLVLKRWLLKGAGEPDPAGGSAGGPA